MSCICVSMCVCVRGGCCTTYIFGHLCSLVVTTVKNLLEVVHPYLGQSNLVTSNYLRALGKGVGALSAENMADNRAGNDLQLSATLPDLQVNGRQHKQTHNDGRLETPTRLSAGWQEERHLP